MTPGPPSDKVLLTHIAECIQRIGEYTDGQRRATFYQSTMVQDAVLRNLQTLAESTQRLAQSLKDAEPDIPWRSIAGFRNVLTHGYLEVDRAVVWSVIEKDLPDLAAAVERMAAVGRMPDPEGST